MSTSIIRSIPEFQSVRSLQSFREKTIGFVPTMGALHEGHATLLSRARRECDFVVASIFVNPTQFNDPKDFEKYPKTWEQDLDILNQKKCDFLFAPEYKSLYPDDYRYKVSETEFSKLLCGAHRPGHFDGVLSVVMKLFQIVRPTHAYFGEKDYQQLQLIQGMVQAFFLDLTIVPCPTVREADGLAMSSRNTRLSPEGRALARRFPALLSQKKSDGEIISDLETAGFKVDYVEDRGGRRFGAVFCDNVRLIDNILIGDR